MEIFKTPIITYAQPGAHLRNLQSVGMIRRAGSTEFECKMKKADGNTDIRMECEKDATFKEDFQNSLKPTKELLEDVLGKPND